MHALATWGVVPMPIGSVPSLVSHVCVHTFVSCSPCVRWIGWVGSVLSPKTHPKPTRRGVTKLLTHPQTHTAGPTPKTPPRKSYNLSLHDVLLISRVAACFLLAMYLQLIIFQARCFAYCFG